MAAAQLHQEPMSSQAVHAGRWNALQSFHYPGMKKLRIRC
jgi:hypothetical protein